MTEQEAKLLIEWYGIHKRQLPWRENRDPYRIWVSETMLQQTTTTAVLGYYERFLQKFPTLKTLASSQIEDVYQIWAGLGYYSRARNLHKAAIELNERGGFPQTYEKLLAYSGFGPYTARAVSSLAFSEKVAVLDGNVIRVITRKENLKWPWWQNKVRTQLQAVADEWVLHGSESATWNQAVMELGSQICIPKNPKCNQCPWMLHCLGRKKKSLSLLPLKKPKKESEIWIWRPQVIRKGRQIKIVRNEYTPFLRKAWFLPGTAQLAVKKPKRFHFWHGITHHDIYVQLDKAHKKNKLNSGSKPEARWVNLEELSRYAPSSLIKKVLAYEAK